MRHNGAPYTGMTVLLLWRESIARGLTSPMRMTFKQSADLDAHGRKTKAGSLVIYAGHTEQC